MADDICPSVSCTSTSCGTAPAPRQDALRHALRLEYLTVSWNIVEGIIAVTAAVAAGSVALLGFGIDSFVECASGLVHAAGGRVVESGPLAGDARTHPNKSRFVKGFKMSAEDKRDLLAFLGSLTDWELVNDPRFSDPWQD